MDREQVKAIIAREVTPLIIENRNLRESLAQVGINPPTAQERAAVEDGLCEAFGFPAIEKRKGNKEQRARRKVARLTMGKGRPFVNQALTTEHYNRF